MGGLITVIIGVLAAVAFYGTGHPILFSFSVVVSFLCFWSWNVMHNYALRSAKDRRDYILEIMIREGKSSEEIKSLNRTPMHYDSRDIYMIPNWITNISMIAALAGFILLCWGVIVRFY